ncbi:MAG TPA: helix-turn-helix transcriptional regulator [Pseudolabrys sp.]|nr:helix-turn-helix transcriptional regulator [Pseudolabrys sp.]
MAADRLSLKSLGNRLQQKRGSMGIRAAAGEIGISPATLSRIENGRVPDLDTLKKVCRWLEVDPSEYLGSAPEARSSKEASLQVVFKKDRAVTQATSKALGKLIVAAYQQFSKIDAAGHQ